MEKVIHIIKFYLGYLSVILADNAAGQDYMEKLRKERMKRDVSDQCYRKQKAQKNSKVSWGFKRKAKIKCGRQ